MKEDKYAKHIYNITQKDCWESFQPDECVGCSESVYRSTVRLYNYKRQ